MIEWNSTRGVGESGVKGLFDAGGVHVLVGLFFFFGCILLNLEVCLRFLPRFDAISHSKLLFGFAFLIFFPLPSSFICERC